MKLNHSEILNKITTLLKNQFPNKIINTFQNDQLHIPLNDEVIIVETFSGSEIKVVVDVKIYIPRDFGPSLCKNRAEKIEKLIKTLKIKELKEIKTQNIDFDVFKNAYVQKMKVIFEKTKDMSTLIVCGEEILISKETSLSFTKNIATYYSPLTGPTIKIIGKTIKKIDGSAKINPKQLLMFMNLADTGKEEIIKIENRQFKAILTSLNAKLNGTVKFSFLEVLPHENSN